MLGGLVAGAGRQAGEASGREGKQQARPLAAAAHSSRTTLHLYGRGGQKNPAWYPMAAPGPACFPASMAPPACLLTCGAVELSPLDAKGAKVP